MAEVKLRLNLDTEEVELVVDGQVALSSGQDVFTNWVEAYNDKHGYVVGQTEKPENPVEPKVVDVNTSETVDLSTEEEVEQDS